MNSHDRHGKRIKSAVSNQQVAPSILKALGIDPSQLQAVRKEQITVLPFLFTDTGMPFSF